jgi:hypothetical protein
MLDVKDIMKLSIKESIGEKEAEMSLIFVYSSCRKYNLELIGEYVIVVRKK